MSNVEPQYESTKRLQQLRIVHLAMWAGCVLFLAVALFMRAGGPVDPNRSLLTTIAVGYGLLMLLASRIVPALIVRQRLQKMKPAERAGYGDDAAEALPQLVDLYWTQKIVGFALLEGGIFFLLIVYLVEGQLVSLLVAGLFLIGFLEDHPTQGRMEEWIEKQSRREFESAGE